MHQGCQRGTLIPHFSELTCSAGTCGIFGMKSWLGLTGLCGNLPRTSPGRGEPSPALVPAPLLPLAGACECGGSWNPKAPSWQCHLPWDSTATAWPSSPRSPSSLWTSTCTAGNQEQPPCQRRDGIVTPRSWDSSELLFSVCTDRNPGVCFWEGKPEVWTLFLWLK